MAKRENDSITERIKKQVRQYTLTELEIFDDFLRSKCMKTVTLKDIETKEPENVRIIDWHAAETIYGVRTANGVIVNGVRRQDKAHINPYEEFQNKRSQWEKWNYGKEMQTEDYSRMIEREKAEVSFNNY